MGRGKRAIGVSRGSGFEQAQARLYHTTDVSSLPALLAEGLRAGQRIGMTEAGSWADACYGGRPCYLSLEQGHRLRAFAAAAVVAVDVEGLELLADLPSLVDHGAYVDEGASGPVLWWEEGEQPPELAPFLDDGGIAAAALLADPALAHAARRLTKTAALLGVVGPERLRLI